MSFNLSFVDSLKGSYALAGSLATLALLAGCATSSSYTAQADQQNQRSAHSSSSTTAPSATAEQNSTTGQVEEEARQPVSLDHESVQHTQNLYTEFEEILAENNAAISENQQNLAEESEEGTPAGSIQHRLSDEAQKAIEKVATGAAADEFSATALEYSINGWLQQGSAKIVGEPRLGEAEYQGHTAQVLEVCLDSSEVSVTDSAGNTRSVASTPRSLNIFTLIEENGSWKIASHDFPDNPDC